MKVKNMTSSRGNQVPNQFIIGGAIINRKCNDKETTETLEGSMFQSYDSNIAFVCHKTGTTFLDSDKWDYSTATGKYLNQFLGEGIAETRKKIASGEYILTDLNREA